MPDQPIPQAADAALIKVTVCACTFRRPQGLRSLLEGVARQKFLAVPKPLVTLVIVDNECNEVNRQICEQAGREFQLKIHYLQQSQRGISYARNTYLDNLPPDTDFIALIDDDEIPSDQWLDQLLSVQQHTSADIVAGPALAQFPQATPQWLIDTGYFDIPFQPSRFTNLAPSPPTATCNALLRASIFSETGIRFDPRLAYCGSEDAMLFQHLKQLGFSFHWAAQAQVTETVDRQRATLGYALSEAFRRGSTRFYIKCQVKGGKFLKHLKIALRMALRSLYGLLKNSLCALVYRFFGSDKRPRAALHLMYASENLGELAGIAGLRKRHY